MGLWVVVGVELGRIGNWRIVNPPAEMDNTSVI